MRPTLVASRKVARPEKAGRPLSEINWPTDTPFLMRHAHQRLPEIAALQHADESGLRFLKPVGDVLAIADAPIGDAGRNGLQESSVVKPDWSGVSTLKQALDTIRTAERETPPGTWIIVIGGWDPYQFAEKRSPTSIGILT
jgi:hypothetical protein